MDQPQAGNSDADLSLDMPDWSDGLPGGMLGPGLSAEDLGMPPRPSSSNQPEPEGDEEQGRRKRKRDRDLAEQESFETLLAELGREDTAQLDNWRAPGSSGRPSAAAARNKASRERQRRERLNDCFADLAKVLEPGKASKTDKAHIISDAIRIVTQLRGENGQLRQLNKFLEERVSQCEKAKSELMLQQALMRGQSHFAPGSAHVPQSPSHRTASPHMFAGQVPSMVQGVALGLPAMQVRDPTGTAAAAGGPGSELPAGGRPAQPQHQYPAAAARSGSMLPDLGPYNEPGSMQHLHAQHSQSHPLLGCSSGLQPQGSLHARASLPAQGHDSVRPQAGHSGPGPEAVQGQPQRDPGHMGQLPGHIAADAMLVKQELPGPMDFGMFPGGMSSWLPPSTLDISQDSIRRPPAA